MDDAKHGTKKYYDENAGWWARERSDVEYNRDYLRKFQRFCPTGKIIELGCGQGRDAGLLISAGYDYTGIDLSPGMIEEAKKAYPAANLIAMDVCDLKFQDKAFDAFWSSAAYLHVPKTEIAHAIDELCRVLKPGSFGYITMKKGSGERQLESDEDRRHWSFYGKNQFANILTAGGFEVLDFWEDRRKYDPPKDVTIFLNYIVKKPVLTPVYNKDIGLKQ